MSVFTSPDLSKLLEPEKEKPKRKRKPVVIEESERAKEVKGRYIKQMDSFHSLDVFPDKDVEALLIKQMQSDYEKLGTRPTFPKGYVKFNPSSSSKCERELYYRAKYEEKDERIMHPYQKRWVLNGSAIHAARQKDLLMSAKFVDNAPFSPFMLPTGLPAWEQNILRYKEFEHNNQKFIIYGMCDGILDYNELNPEPGKEKSLIGWEFKTKSTTVAAIGDYKLKEPQSDHKMQISSYNLLFSVSEWLIVYETLAKDGWTKGEEAKPDMKVFHVQVTEEDRNRILDKFARVTAMVNTNTLPPKEEEKCLFCPFKTACAKEAN